MPEIARPGMPEASLLRTLDDVYCWTALELGFTERLHPFQDNFAIRCPNSTRPGPGAARTSSGAGQLMRWASPAKLGTFMA